MGLLDRILGKKEKDDRDEFAELLRKRLEAAGLCDLIYHKADFSLRVGNTERTIFLNNVYSDYSNAPKAHRSGALDRYVKAFLQATGSIPKSFEDVKGQLLPIVRDAAFFSMARLQLATADKGASKFHLPAKPIAPSLRAGLAHDTEHNIAFVNQETLESWGATLEDALTIAIGNLRDRTAPNGLRQVQPGLYASQWRDSYDSSRILLPDYFHRLDLDGDPVVFVPNRDQLWVTGHRNSAGIAAILKDGEESHFKLGHSLSCELHRLTDSGWQTCLPEDPEQRTACLNMQRQRAGMDYAQQAGYLKKIHERDKVDVFVASLRLYNSNRGPFSVCVWGNGVDSLLPRAEYVALGISLEKKDHIFVPWDTVVAVAGGLMEEQLELAPPLYRVRAFPDATQLEELRKAAVSLGN